MEDIRYCDNEPHDSITTEQWFRVYANTFGHEDHFLTKARLLANPTWVANYSRIIHVYYFASISRKKKLACLPVIKAWESGRLKDVRGDLRI